MKGFDEKDGLSRSKRMEEAKVLNPFRVMDDDPFHLFARALENASFIRYYNLENTPDGYWEELYSRQPVVVLFEIKQLSLQQQEQLFTRQYIDGQKDIIFALLNRMQQWLERLNSAVFSIPNLLLTVELKNQIEVNLRDLTNQLVKRSPDRIFSYPSSSIWTSTHDPFFGVRLDTKELVRSLFYRIMESIRLLQDNYELYFKDIEQIGLTDPSVAIILAFIKSYSDIVGGFNKRWEALSGFYIQKILHVRPLAFKPDTTWLVLTPGERVDSLSIPAKTGFIAGKQSDDVPIIYRNDKEVYISRMRLQEIIACFLCDRLLLRKNISICISPEDPAVIPSQPLFSNQGAAEPVSMGLLVESSLFLLKEGERQGCLQFILDEKSRQKFSGQLTKPLFLNEAFCPEISTEGGWMAILKYDLTYVDETGTLIFTFCLPMDFPATIAACCELHDITTRMPVLRLTMNPESIYYPYLWAKECLIERVKIRVQVAGATTLDIRTVSGPVSSSQPFYPFGPMPERGDWMIWGCEELAAKPLITLQLSCEWLQLPVSTDGFAGIYKSYTPPLDNSSFKIQTDLSSENQWKTSDTALKNLFSFSFSKGKVETTSSFSWSVDPDIPSDGLFRIVLAEPEIGFGYSTFRELFSDVMIRNSFERKKVLPPVSPVTPLMDHLQVSYTSEEEIIFQPGQKEVSTTLYYFRPLMEDCVKKIETDEPFLLYDGIENDRNLLFGIAHTAGERTIRLFVDVNSLKRTLSTVCEAEVRWLLKQGQWTWIKLEPEVLLVDTTQGFLKTGLIELLLPEPIREEWLDKSGVCWICAAFKNQPEFLSPLVNSFYLNAFEVGLDVLQKGFDEKQLPGSLPAGTIVQAETDLPGIESILQIVPANGGCPQETVEEQRVRVANRIAHRNRAITKRDYEELAVANFPEIGKAYCFPEERMERQASVVSLFVVPERYAANDYPLCPNTLLWRIEAFLQKRTSLFVKLEVHNPNYEEVTVRCWFKPVRSEIPLGVLEKEMIQRINHCISPWLALGEPPVFNYSFTLDDLRHAIGNSDYIEEVRKLVVLQRTIPGLHYFYLKDYCSGEEERKGAEEQIIQASRPGRILYPARKHLLRTTGDEKWHEYAGIGELEINNTFIIR